MWLIRPGWYWPIWRFWTFSPLGWLAAIVWNISEASGFRVAGADRALDIWAVHGPAWKEGGMWQRKLERAGIAAAPKKTLACCLIRIATGYHATVAATPCASNCQGRKRT